jgi:hypothetical protein
VSYYGQGDYYRGDYYRGDPGIFDFIGKVGSSVASFLAPGPIGAAIKTISGAISGGGRPAAATPVTPAPMLNVARASTFGVDVTAPFMSGSSSLTLGSGGAKQVAGGKRLHPNKTTYVTRGGGTSHWPKGLKVHAKGSTLVGPRRMNPGNGRALHRAARRIHSAVRMYRKIFSISHAKPMRGHPFVKRRRSKR